MTGLGLFLGPAISAALIVLTGGFQTPLLVAGLGLLLSVPPLLLVPAPATRAPSVERGRSIWQEMRTGWQFIRRHSAVWQVLFYLVHFTLVMGAVMPLITPLAHKLGLGSEGTAVFFSAVGLGGLIGAPLAVVLAKRLSLSAVLLLTGLLAPVGALFLGLMGNLEGALAAVTLIALAGASLNIIVVTVLQRLTPLKMQGCVFGVEQTLLGIAWVVSLGMITGGLAIWPEGANGQLLFLLVGGVGLLTFVAGWFRYRHQIQAACEKCEPRLQVLGAVCQVICESGFQLSGIACRVIGGGHARG